MLNTTDDVHMEASRNSQGDLVLDEECVRHLMPLLLFLHLEQSDVVSRLIAQLMREYGEIQSESGTVGHDYSGVIVWDDATWVVRDNNAYARIDLQDNLSDVD